MEDKGICSFHEPTKESTTLMVKTDFNRYSVKQTDFNRYSVKQTDFNRYKWKNCLKVESSVKYQG